MARYSKPQGKPPQSRIAARRRLRGLTALFAATMAAAAGAQTAPPPSAGIQVNQRDLPQIDGCMAPGGLVRVTSQSEANDSPFWCGTPPMCLTVLPGAFNGTSYHCSINPYSRREPRGNPAGAAGANPVRVPEDLTCEQGLYAGGRPVGGICPPIPVPPPPPPPPAPAPSVTGTASFRWPSMDMSTLIFIGYYNYLQWSSPNAARADVIACSERVSGFTPITNQAPNSEAMLQPLYGDATCTVRFWDATMTTSFDAVANFTMTGVSAPPPPPACPPGSSWGGSSCIPSGSPSPAPAPACTPPEVWDPVGMICSGAPAPAPAPAECPAQTISYSGYQAIVVGYQPPSDSCDAYSCPIYSFVPASYAAGAVPASQPGTTFRWDFLGSDANQLCGASPGEGWASGSLFAQCSPSYTWTSSQSCIMIPPGPGR